MRRQAVSEMAGAAPASGAVGQAPEPPRAGPSPLVLWYRVHERALLGVVGVVGVIACWQVCSDSHLVDPQFASSPWEVAKAFKTYYAKAADWNDLRVSATEFGIGFALALLFGLPLGVLMGRSRRADALIEPIFNFVYASPRIALVPLFIIWFGIGTESKVAIVFLASSLPLALNARLGVITPPRELVTLARSCGASRIQLFRTVLIPGAVPAVVSGIRLAIGQGLVAVIVGELIASTAGIGYRIEQSSANFDTPDLFVGLITVAGAGVILTYAVRLVERRLDSWRVT